jgi:hypothetical protein
MGAGQIYPGIVSDVWTGDVMRSQVLPWSRYVFCQFRGCIVEPRGSFLPWLTGRATAGPRDPNLSERSVSIANGAVAMIEAAKAGMSVNEELYGSTPKRHSRLGV